MLEVQPSTVRQLVARGHLNPQRPGARPLLFDQAQVEDLEHSRLPAAELTRFRQLAVRWAKT